MARRDRHFLSDSKQQETSQHPIEQKNRDVRERFSVGWSAFPLAFLSMFAMFTYAKTQNPVSLYFTLIVIFLVLGFPPLIDFFKSAALKGMAEEKEKRDSSNKVMDRIENLEAVMCRLDAEINSQLEQTLSAGKITTFESSSSSQMPTLFLNISSALENRFQLLKELGRGGMGIVFQAYDKQLKEQVAIKVLSPLLSNNAEALERLKREVSAARRITHPNVIRIHDISESEGLHFVSMEYFHGVTLRELIQRNGSCSLNHGAQIAFQICDGLEGAHRQSVIHRDLKSQNIIVNDTGVVKIIDFGLAFCAQMEGMTATGLVLGTPEYMSPEQVSGKKADERADIYSFGIILYEIFTGRVPFTGESAISVGFQQLRDEPLPPSEVNPKISAELEQVILKALQKNPADRYSSIQEMRLQLEDIFRGMHPVTAIREQSVQESAGIIATDRQN
jgi:serine/threonine-protein kinase